MSKLTLSVDDQVVRRAKQFAKDRGTSVSELVQGYLDAVSRPLTVVDDAPVLREIKGILRKGDREDYRQHLIKKYQ
jgi:hypothetical protein